MDSLHNTPSLSPNPLTTTQQHTPFPHENRQMASFSGDRRVSKIGQRPQQETEQFPCPRCNSTITKFCYYNNYNLSQPRHFCKSCRRYWTRGGALRNVPVGGGTRKTVSSNKRSRLATTATPTVSSDCKTVDSDRNGAGLNQDSDPGVSTHDPCLVSGSPTCVSVSLSDAGMVKSGSLNSWWNGQMGLGDPGLSFYGPGPGYGIGVLDWPTDPVGRDDGGAVLLSGDSPGFNTWQISGGAEGGLNEADCFSLPDLAIPGPAEILK